MENYISFFTKLYELFKAHPDVPISIAALILSFISIVIVFRDRSNHISTDLFTYEEAIEHRRIKRIIEQWRQKHIFVILHNTGRTNLYVSGAYLRIDKIYLPLIDSDEFSKSLIPTDYHRVLEPFRERLYEFDIDLIGKIPELSKKKRLKMKPYFVLESGVKTPWHHKSRCFSREKLQINEQKDDQNGKDRSQND